MLRLRLRRCVNEPLLTTFDRMIDCDVLVMSRSSLSACAAYLKPASGLVLYHPFWHEMLSPEDGHVPCDAPDLDARCERFVREFSEGEQAHTWGIDNVYLSFHLANLAVSVRGTSRSIAIRHRCRVALRSQLK